MDPELIRELQHLYVNGISTKTLTKQYRITYNQLSRILPRDPAYEWLLDYIQSRVEDGMIYVRPIHLVEEAHADGVLPSTTRRYTDHAVSILKTLGFVKYSNRKQSVFVLASAASECPSILQQNHRPQAQASAAGGDR